ncbi:coiled-coil domain-containing protein 86 [Phlebotomus papatasi]|uniref:coiled-coil domain-containing protein 86 n=1 Tax=Phlebotomus papatasi TaxID=29031 RepID=UPI00248360F0|nr:coiled-coil domain-containing protein 86 [Phlebotomus papatasi]
MGRTKKSPKKLPETGNSEKMDTDSTENSSAVPANPPPDTNKPLNPSSKKSAPAKAKKGNDVPRGIPKSGRVWKSQKQKFSTIKKSLHRRTFEKKEQLREEIKQIKELSRSIKEQKQQEKEQLKQRREENEKRKLENQRKSEIVQIIKNPAKLKRIRKKQLRMIEKRDLSTVKAI